jgi:single stranded DNA-binding protein
MNQVALVGIITDDPELRYTQSGAALANFTVAVSHRSKHNGEWQDVNYGFFRCTAWRSVAENAARTLKKGMRIFVAGKPLQRSYRTTTATSVKRSRSRSPTWDRTSSFSRPKSVLRLRPQPGKSKARGRRSLSEPRPGLRRVYEDSDISPTIQ